MRLFLTALMGGFLLPALASAGAPDCSITPAFLTEAIKVKYPGAIRITLTGAGAQRFIEGFNQLPPPGDDRGDLVLIFTAPGHRNGYTAIFDKGCKVDGGTFPVGILQELAGAGA